MNNLIVPCAGQSTRYPKDMPKYLMVMPDMKPMMYWAVENFLNICNIFFAVRKEDNDKHGSVDIINQFIPSAKILILDGNTKGPADTINRTINYFDIEGDTLVHDCDCSFKFEEEIAGNGLAVAWRETAIGDRGDKSWVKIKEKLVIDIIEKQDPTNWYCCGGYCFSNPRLFCDTYDRIKSNIAEPFCSNVIQDMISNGETFRAFNCTSIDDWGTFDKLVAWKNKHKVYLFDLDGVIFKAGRPYGKNQWKDAFAIPGVSDKIKLLKYYGNYIVLLTSRTENERGNTVRALEDAKIPFDKLIMNIPGGSRVSINDYAPSSPYSAQTAINTARNSGDWIEKL